MKNSSFPVGRVKNAHGIYYGRTVLNRVLNLSSEPQSSTTYRSFVQRYRECERNAILWLSPITRLYGCMLAGSQKEQSGLLWNMAVKYMAEVP